MTFDFTPTDDGFRIHDAIENVWTDVGVGGATEPGPASTDVFRVPLDDAVTVEVESLRFGRFLSFIVRDQTDSIVGRFLAGDPLDVDAGTYELDSTLSLFKLYVHTAGSAFRIVDGADGTHITFDGPTAVTVGVRSNHEQPAGVVTSARDPRDLMQAVSTFGSAMKTFSPERSYPSLRGHPPELAVRGQTSIPEAFAPPDTGITVEIPPEYAAVFTATPLAYYLGATIEPGLEPRFIAGDTVHEFDPARLVEDVHALFRHCFLLDTVVRTAGIYPLDLAAERQLSERTTLDTRTLYDLPIADRTARYLDIPFETTRDLIAWPTVADIDPVPLNAEALPYLAYRMATIRSPARGRTGQTDCVDSRDSPVDRGPSSSVRSFTPGEPDAGNSVSFVDPVPFDADHHIWVADGLPRAGSKPTLGSYLRSTDASPSGDTIDVHVVDTGTRNGESPECIARQYSNEGFTVTIHEDPTARQLKDVLLTDQDFLHYVGDVTDEGLECLDGPLDVRTLPRTGLSAFFLDGECSYRQGLALIRVGSIGGVVTTTATRPDIETPGRTLAALLDYGFSLAAAVDVLRDLGDDANYTIVGDAYHQVSNSTRSPALLEAQPGRSTPERVTVLARCYPTLSHQIGSTIEYPGDADQLAYLNGEHEVTMTRETFETQAAIADSPVLVDQELHWTDRDAPDDFWDLLQ